MLDDFEPVLRELVEIGLMIRTSQQFGSDLYSLNPALQGIAPGKRGGS